MKKKNYKNNKNKKVIKTRDYNMVNIINGVTKSGVHKDRKKEADKYSAREDIDEEDHDIGRCKQCGFPEPEKEFCSDSCKEFWEEQHGG